MNFSGVRLDMSFKEAKALDAMLSRDEPKPILENRGFINGEPSKYYTCPMCGERVYDEDNFCRECGQRLDTKNIAL